MSLKDVLKRSTALIGKNSNNNTVIQNSNIYIGNPTSEVINTLSGLGQYGAIQQHYSDYLSIIKQSHPLYPIFSASPSKTVDKLVSTPETKDAFEKFPKTIKGTFKIDYTKYPYMDKSETPWEYAYRTQTEVELETTAYQEYLGDIPDPFPNAEYRDGMVTVIGYNEFPKAMEGNIVSGEVVIPILIRRKPCLEYGKMIVGTIPNGCGFELNITSYKDEIGTDFTITNIQNCDLNTRLLRERLYSEFLRTKQMSITVGDEALIDYTFSDDELKNVFFLNAPVIARHIECLLIIEKHMECKFEISNKGFTQDDYETAMVLASSLEGKWYRENVDFDNSIRCDFDKIPEGIDSFEQISFTNSVDEISLHGKLFSAEKIIIVYQGARLNNIKSVVKNKEKRKKAILLTFRPVEGKEMFSKYFKFENIRLKTV